MHRAGHQTLLLPSYKQLLVALLPFFLVVKIDAQTVNVWESGRKRVQSTKSAAAKKTSSIKVERNHIQPRGLDSAHTHSFLLAGRLNTNGWGAGILHCRKSKAGNLSLWQLTFSEVKDEKETKQKPVNTTFPELGSGRPYIFGKINNVYTFQIGYGKEKTFERAILEGTVAVGFRYSGGLSIAMLKPYYLELIYPDYSFNPRIVTSREEVYTETNKERFLNSGLILGKGCSISV